MAHVKSKLFSSAPLFNITEKDVNKMPAFQNFFCGKLRLIRGPSDEERFSRDLANLHEAEVLGFDTKSTPSCPPSIIQLSTQDQCFVWRIRQNVKYSTSKSTWLSPELTKILTSEKILKVGHGSIADAISLLKSYRLEIYNLLDTFQLATQLGIQQLSLRGLVGMFLGYNLEKRKEMVASNWESPYLRPEQLGYAMNDPWASLKVYEALLKYISDTNNTLQVNPIKRSFGLLKPSDQEAILEKLSGEHHNEVHRSRQYNHTNHNLIGSIPNNNVNGHYYNREHLSFREPVYMKEDYVRRVTQKWYYIDKRYTSPVGSNFQTRQQSSPCGARCVYNGRSNGNHVEQGSEEKESVTNGSAEVSTSEEEHSDDDKNR